MATVPVYSHIFALGLQPRLTEQDQDQADREQNAGKQDTGSGEPHGCLVSPRFQ